MGTYSQEMNISGDIISTVCENYEERKHLHLQIGIDFIVSEIKIK